MKVRECLKRVSLVLCCLAVALSLSACEAVDSVVDNIMPTGVEEARQSRRSSITPAVGGDVLVQEGVLTVGLDTTSTAPLCFTNSTGDTVGIDVDLAYALADQLGLDIRFVPVSGVSGAVSTSIDILMGATAGSTAEYTVLGGYAERAIAFFHKGPQTVVSAADLTGHSCGVQGGSASERALERAGISMSQSQYSNLNEAFNALDQGQVEYVLCDAYSGAYLAATHDGISCVGTIDAPVPVGVGVRTANVELQSAVQSALDTLSSNGVGALARSRWVGNMQNLDATYEIASTQTAPEPTPEAPVEG